MMDLVFATHKQTPFGWVLAVQRLAAMLRARSARLRTPAGPAPRRYLTLR